MLFLAATAWAKPLSESIDYAAYEPSPDYSVVRLPFIDDEGYSTHYSEAVQMKWKADIYLPEDGPVFGLHPFNPFAIIRLHIKDIRGEFRLSGMYDWEGLDQFEREPSWLLGKSGLLERGYYIKGVSEVTAYRKHLITSFLGNTLASPPTVIDRVNGQAITTFTTYVPINRKVIDIYRSALFFRLGERTFFFANAGHLIGIIYVDENLKLLVHAGLSLIVLLLVALILKYYVFIPQLNLRSKDLFFVVLLCLILMMQLAQITPNPVGVAFTMEGAVIKYNGASVQHYLRLLTGLTKSVDTLVINDLAWCEPKVFETNRNLYLITRSVQKVYISESLYHSPGPCNAGLKPYFGDKLTVLPDNEVSLAQTLDRDKNLYPWKTLWEVNRRIIFLLFMLFSFLSTAVIMLWAFEIENVFDWLRFGVGAFFYALVVQFFNLAVAFVAGLPITYHGTSNLPLTMSVRAIPLFNQSHNLRLAILLLGVLFVFVFTASARQKVNIRAFLLPVLLLGLLLAAPQTEYSTKAFILSFACGECGFEYKGKIDSFDIMKIYSSMRGDSGGLDAITGISEDIDERENYNRATLLQAQTNYAGAIDLYEEYLVTYPIGPHYISVLEALAVLNHTLYQNSAAERYLEVTLENELDEGPRTDLTIMLYNLYLEQGKTKEAGELIREQANLITSETPKAILLTRLGFYYLEREHKLSEARQVFIEVLSMEQIRVDEAIKAREGLKKIAAAEQS